jgi:HEPN domain-containing protein
VKGLHYDKSADGRECASSRSKLREEREISFYGQEKTEFPPQELYSMEDAAEAISAARFVYGLCEHIINTP